MDGANGAFGVVHDVLVLKKLGVLVLFVVVHWLDNSRSSFSYA